MKKILFLLLAFLPSFALARVCKLDMDPVGATISDRGAMWQIKANKPGIGDFFISGLAACSVTPGSVNGTRGSPSPTRGMYCWCKMTSPREGGWIYMYGATSTGICTQACSIMCMQESSPAFFNALLAPL